MSSLEIGLIISNIFFFSALCASIYFNIRYGIIILKITDSLESALDILDVKYASMAKILEIPLFFDSPQVKSVIDDIKSCQDAILRVANVVGKIEEINTEEESA